MDDHLQALGRDGFAWIRDCGDAEQAFELARALFDARYAGGGLPPVRLIGDFVLPPPDAPASRDFQTLHFDFGIPFDPKVPHEVGRYTALYIPTGVQRASAVTRLVPLARLLGQRAWPPERELLDRLIAYGKTHGAWEDDHGYVEGSLARVIEAAAGAPALPSVKLDPDFLCGMEFDSLDAELRFFARHCLRVEEVQVEVPLSPGELLVFDNLAVAHGRRGVRKPGELRQWVFGETAGVARQCELRSQVLLAFGALRSGNRAAPTPASV